MTAHSTNEEALSAARRHVRNIEREARALGAALRWDTQYPEASNKATYLSSAQWIAEALHSLQGQIALMTEDPK